MSERPERPVMKIKKDVVTMRASKMMAVNAVLVAALGWHLQAQSQAQVQAQSSVTSQAATQAQGSAAAQAAAQNQAAQQVNSSTAARFIQNCNDALERGVVAAGCQAPIYRNELERLKSEAITTHNPRLLSFVGDAYLNPRSGYGDIGQAYRWYLMAAVRGDPQAMQKLAEMNKAGTGVPKDNVKAMGYARLVQRMTQQGVTEQTNMVSLINELGDEMAVEEIALAERFAGQLEAQIQRQAGGGQDLLQAGEKPQILPVAPEPNFPGLPHPAVPSPSQPAPAVHPGAAIPGTVLPGVPLRQPS